MNERIEAYLTHHPNNRTNFEKLYEMIDRLNQCHNSTLKISSVETGHTVTVISRTENPKVQVAFFVSNNVDNPTLLISGGKTYSFAPEDIKYINSELLPDSAGMRYTLNLLQHDNQYTLQFDLK